MALDNLLSDVNMITMSSHKIYGPKGIGLLLIDEEINLEPLIVGGGQEYGLRSGTIPLPLVVGFAKAIEIADFNQKKLPLMLSMINAIVDDKKLEFDWESFR